MSSLSLAPYLLARVGLSLPVFLATDQLPPKSLMRPDPVLHPRRQAASGTQISAGYIFDQDPNTELQGQLWYGAMGSPGVAQKMLRDPHVRQSIRYIADPLGGASWKFTTKGKRPIDLEAAAFAEWAFLEQIDFDKYRERAVINYASCGFDIHEMTDDIRPIPSGRFPLHPGAGSCVAPTGLYEIPCNTVERFHQSKKNPNHIDYIEQWSPHSSVEGFGFREIFSDRFIRLTYCQEGAQFSGMSVLRSAYGPWKLKTAFQTIEAILHDRCGVPYPAITLAENPQDEDIDAAELILAQMRSNPRGYMTLPHGYVFKWEQASGDDAENLREAIIRCNVDIAYNVSAAFMTLGTNMKTGSFALAGTQQGQYHLSTVGHAKFFVSGLNRGLDGWSPVERIIRLNYGEDVIVPSLVATNLPTHPWADVAKTIINAVSARAITVDDATENRLREMLELQPKDPNTARTILDENRTDSDEGGDDVEQ